MLGFSLQGTTIPAGEGVLVVMDLTGDGDACLADLVISDSSGNALDATVEDCTTISIGGGDVYGCMDMDACNYNADATVDDGGCEYAMENYDCNGNCTTDVDCAGDCGGSAMVDECGVCGGDNSSCADCAGVPNGDAVEDECGVCDGDGPDMCWDGSYECDSSDCPDQPGGSVEINYNSDTAIAGFQFGVSGVDVTGAGGGAAGEAGFTVSTGNNTVLGFSLQGATIPAGEGVLLVLEVTGSGDACLSDLVISDSSGSALDATVEDCTTISIGD